MNVSFLHPLLKGPGSRNGATAQRMGSGVGPRSCWTPALPLARPAILDPTALSSPSLRLLIGKTGVVMLALQSYCEEQSSSVHGALKTMVAAIIVPMTVGEDESCVEIANVLEYDEVSLLKLYERTALRMQRTDGKRERRHRGNTM